MIHFEGYTLMIKGVSKQLMRNVTTNRGCEMKKSVFEYDLASSSFGANLFQDHNKFSYFKLGLLKHAF